MSQCPKCRRQLENCDCSYGMTPFDQKLRKILAKVDCRTGTIDEAISAIKSLILAEMPKEKECYDCGSKYPECGCKDFNDAIQEIKRRLE